MQFDTISSQIGSHCLHIESRHSPGPALSLLTPVIEQCVYPLLRLCWDHASNSLGWLCRLTLAKCLQSPEGMTALRAELDGGGETDAAMAFLATAIKDHGAVAASNSLFRCTTGRLYRAKRSALPAPSMQQTGLYMQFGTAQHA